jgi:CheY-like chemotaxis protein
VTVVGNGREAVDAVTRRAYDVVLMDLQMPVMDGLAATETIRARERDLGGHVRIVAMTAHARDADRERCLAGGMDGYVTTPFEPSVLFEAVERDNDQPETASQPRSIDGPASSAIDEAQLLQRLRGDRELMTDVLRLFFEDLPERLERLRAAAADGDMVRVGRAAHTLKGTAATAAATGLAAEAGRIEALARLGDHDAVARSLAGLDAELAPLMRVMDTLPASSW